MKELVGIALFCFAVTCIIVGLMRPYRNLVPNKANPENFRMGDFFSLGVLMIPCMSISARQYSDDHTTEIVVVTLGVLLIGSLTFWGGLCLWLSRHGIYQSTRRFLFVSVCIPGTLTLAILGPTILVFSLAAAPDGILHFDSPIITFAGAFFGYALGCAAIYGLNRWIAKPAKAASIPSKPTLKTPKADSGEVGSNEVLPWE